MVSGKTDLVKLSKHDKVSDNDVHDDLKDIKECLQTLYVFYSLDIIIVHSCIGNTKLLAPIIFKQNN